MKIISCLILLLSAYCFYRLWFSANASQSFFFGFSSVIEMQLAIFTLEEHNQRLRLKLLTALAERLEKLNKE